MKSCWILLLGLLLSPALWSFDLELVHGDQIWRLSVEDMRELPQIRIETDTPWTERSSWYDGVAVEDLLAVMTGDDLMHNSVRMTALNDYAVETSVEKLANADGVLVYQRDGELMPVRDFGPYWMLFPFSDRPELENRDIRNVSVWQLKRIELLP